VSASRPARIGLVVGQLSTGGAEGQLWQLTRGVDPGRFEPIVYCLSAQTEPIGTQLRRDGVTVRVTDQVGFRRVGWLAGALAADGVELVHTWLFIANALAWAASWYDGSRPLITSARNCKVQGRLSRLANMLAFRRSAAIVVNSHQVEAYIVQRYRAPRRRIHVIYNGIDTDRFHPAAPAGLGPIVTIGRVVEQKNHGLFLEAAAQLAPLVPEARFVIVGEGGLRPMLEARAQSLGIAARVTFAGERRDVETILRTASLFWLTSRWEGLPNVVLEAMASGVPTIATDVGGTRELVRSGVDGFVVPSGEAAGFVQHSQALLSDAAMHRRFAQAARARAEEFSTARMVSGLSQLYDAVLGRGQ